MPDVIQEMQRSSRGWRCAACFAQGRIEKERSDGTSLDEADRCPGCGETICPRHPALADPTARHSVRAHTLATTEVRPPVGT